MAALTVSVSPARKEISLRPGETVDDLLTVEVPRVAGPRAKVDVYFLADTTGSMNPALEAVLGGLSAILELVESMGLDVCFGVGNYKDFPIRPNGGHPFAFKNQCSLTADHDSVRAEMGLWRTTPGRDTPEAQLYALDQVAEPPGGSIGWRSGSKRIVLWLGDAAGHDPVCKEISGLSYDVTETSVTAKLTAERIIVIALSMTTNYRAPAGLDDDPATKATGYRAKCGQPQGEPGQGTRIGMATGGKLVPCKSPSVIVQAITDQLGETLASIRSLRLVPGGDITPFVQSIEPQVGHGPLGRAKDTSVDFAVAWAGAVPCLEAVQSFEGSLDVLADDTVVGSQSVRVRVPARVEEMAIRRPIVDSDAHGAVGKEGAMPEEKSDCLETGRMAGIFAGALSGAELGTLIPVPGLGTLTGAVAGAMVGAKAGPKVEDTLRKGVGLVKGTVRTVKWTVVSAGRSLSTAVKAGAMAARAQAVAEAPTPPTTATPAATEPTT